jgi:hypothetical protein
MDLNMGFHLRSAFGGPSELPDILLRLRIPSGIAGAGARIRCHRQGMQSIPIGIAQLLGSEDELALGRYFREWSLARRTREFGAAQRRFGGIYVFWEE